MAMAIVTPANAQRKKAITKKQPAAPVVEPSKEEINYANLLPATAKVMFIDSLVVDEKDIASHIRISPSSGKIAVETKDSPTNYSYTNEMQTTRYTSICDTTGIHKLYIQQRIGRSWTEPTPVILEGNYTDIICPYLMADGVTLYFAAKNGDDNIGGYDIFYTVFNTDTRTFYRAQSLGLPYNSMADDMYCIIDDTNNIGHLVTKHRQPLGKVCIYTFIPTESRMTYDTESISSEQLAAFASLSSIAATQYDLQQVEKAKQTLASLRNNQFTETEKIHFILNENTIYHKLSDFDSPTNRERYTNYMKRVKELNNSIATLENLRQQFHEGNKSKREQILELEKQVQKERQALTALEKQIRNDEIIRK